MDEDDQLDEAVQLLFGLQAGYYRALDGWLDALTARHYEPCGSDAFCDALTYRIDAEQRGFNMDWDILYKRYNAIQNREKLDSEEEQELQDTLEYMTGGGFFKI